jgi:triphosphoribosyl-dephospho-CoA synthase
MSGLAPDVVAAAYEAACLAELQALKPGNVHVHGAGHRMSLKDFEESAAASAPAIAASGARVGRRVLRAVQATFESVATNTNLGIILLCAPLAAAGERAGDLFADLARVLTDLDAVDTTDVFAAIRIASPGGLGRAETHDVGDEASADLRTVMRAGAERDRIARAYGTNFEDVAAIGLSALDAARADGLTEPWSTSAVYLAFLSAVPDTHVARKFGAAVAEEVRAGARALQGPPSRLAHAFPDLLRFDRTLKERGINPGTSADFTVATLFADRLIRAPRGSSLVEPSPPS